MAYTRSATVYDRVYKFKEYKTETDTLQAMISTREMRPTRTLLDVGCGTGAHLVHLESAYQCVGVDLAPEMIAVAQAKLPSIPFYVGDMRTFDLTSKHPLFDAVISLFSAIGYMLTVADLNTAVSNMARHVVPGGLLIFEAWFYPDGFQDGKVSKLAVDDPDLKLVRTTFSSVTDEGRLSKMDMHHVIDTEHGREHFLDTHIMGLFTHEEYLGALTAAGLRPDYDPKGFIERGLYFGLKPS